MFRVKHMMVGWVAIVGIVFVLVAFITPAAMMFMNGVPAARDAGNYLFLQILAFPIAIIVSAVVAGVTFPVAVVLCAKDLPPEDAGDDASPKPARAKGALSAPMAAMLVGCVGVLAAGAMWLDRGFYSAGGYTSVGDLETPTYAAHGVLFGVYAGLALWLAGAARWKAAIVSLGGFGFGLWSRPVVGLALTLHERGGAAGDLCRRIDAASGADGTGALLVGVLGSGAVMSCVLWWASGARRSAAWALGATAAAAALAAQGWGRGLGETGSLVLIFASGVVWHAVVCAGLAVRCVRPTGTAWNG